jgi:hypothetical protein
MKLWLLNQKRVQDWESTKATADAVYALIRNGNNQLASSPTAMIRLGSTELKPDVRKQALAISRN